ncbi:50S ribosomal protein L25, partial [Rhizobium ruizarguesonis]
FNIDLSGKKIGDSIHISEVTLPKGVTPVIDRDFTIATIIAPAGGIDESAAEGGAEA